MGPQALQRCGSLGPSQGPLVPAGALGGVRGVADRVFGPKSIGMSKCLVLLYDGRNRQATRMGDAGKRRCAFSLRNGCNEWVLFCSSIRVTVSYPQPKGGAVVGKNAGPCFVGPGPYQVYQVPLFCIGLLSRSYTTRFSLGPTFRGTGSSAGPPQGPTFYIGPGPHHGFHGL